MSQAKPSHYIFFDFDGTMVNSLPALIDLYNEIAPGFHCKSVSAGDVERLRNSRPQEFMGEYRVRFWKLPWMVLILRKKVSNIIPEIPVVKGIVDVIKQLKSRGFYVGILTTNSKSNIQKFLGIHKLEPYIDSVFTFKHVFAKHKAIVKMVKDLNIDPGQVIYIGDETRDMEAGKKAGIRVWAASWGFQGSKVLKACLPEKILEFPSDILKELPATGTA